VRIVAALPLHQFMSLNHAFAKAKDCLGSGDLAARDLRQHARDRRLTIAARRIFPDGTEQVLIFRSAYWQYFEIWPPYDSKVVHVRGPITFPGAWYCFVGRRRFDRLYSTSDNLPADPREDEGADEESEVDRLDAWLAELYSHDEWLFLSATAVHQDITARARELTAKSGKQVPGLSYTTVREGLKEKRKSRKSRK
jgi:predicted RNA polymerase sigma factor